MKARCFCASLVLFIGFAALAQTPSVAPHAKVRRLLELTGASKLGLQMIDGMMTKFKEGMPEVPEEFWTGFRAKVKPDDLVDMIIPIYEKHLTDEDLDALIVFYSSPAGRRFVEKQPLILADSMNVGQEWGGTLAKEVIAELQAKGLGPKSP